MSSTIIALDAMSIVILFMVIYGCFVENKTGHKNARTFIVLAIIGSLGTLADLLSYVFIDNTNYGTLAWALDCLTLVFAIWFGVTYCYYVLIHIDQTKKVAILSKYFVFIWGGISTILTVFGCVTGSIFSIVDGHFYTGKYYFVCIFSVLSFAIYSLLIVLKNVKILGHHKSLAFSTYIIAPIITTIIEYIIPGLSINYVGLSLSTLILYTFIQTGDFEALRLNEEAAKRVIKEKSEFLANFSHELRTPINAVLGLDELILRETTNEKVLQYAKDIQSAGKSLLGIINDILNSSKIESCKIEILETSYHIVNVVNDLKNLISIRAQEKNLQFLIEVDPDLPRELFGDDVKIKQIVTNLLTNAVKYTVTGSITLHISYQKISEQEILLKVNVSDTGIGIKPEDMDKLFSRFARIEENRNRYVEGTGLGMFITQSFLDMMGSKLNVNSEYGKGSVFSFELLQKVNDWTPIGNYLIAIDEMHKETHEYKPSFIANEAKALIVDDTKVNLVVCANLLKETQMECVCAKSGKKALEHCRTTVFDIILLDRFMPQMDGIETLQHIKNDEDSLNKHVPVIALTADESSDTRELMMSAGFNDYLTKPIDYLKLEESIMRLMPKEKYTVI